MDSLVVHDLFNVMEKDSVETSHPVSTYVEDPREVQQFFDEISYEKVRKIHEKHLQFRPICITLYAQYVFRRA